MIERVKKWLRRLCLHMRMQSIEISQFYTASCPRCPPRNRPQR
ncbi:hypothetical protein PSPO01_14985 [Paraphaeosphaeria sporulosa]